MTEAQYHAKMKQLYEQLLEHARQAETAMNYVKELEQFIIKRGQAVEEILATMYALKEAYHAEHPELSAAWLQQWENIWQTETPAGVD